MNTWLKTGKTTLAVMAFAGLVASAPASADGWNYQIHFENNSDQDIQVRRVWYKISDWECVKRCGDGRTTIKNGEKWQAQIANALSGRLKYKWKFRWKCSTGSTQEGHQYISSWAKENDTLDFDANMYIEFTGCNEGDITMTHDGQ